MYYLHWDLLWYDHELSIIVYEHAVGSPKHNSQIQTGSDWLWQVEANQHTDSPLKTISLV